MVTANRLLDEIIFQTAFRGLRKRIFKFIDKYIEPKVDFEEDEGAQQQSV